MKVVALRGVCIGPERHLSPGQEADVDESTAAFLASIGAVSKVVAAPEAPAPIEAAPAVEPDPKGAKAPKKGA